MVTLIMVCSMIAADTGKALPEDPFLWLEEVEGEKPLDWVREQNKRTLAVLESDPVFETDLKEAERQLQDKERIPYGALYGKWVFNFWQDQDHIRGLWRRATRESYRSPDPEWEVLIDFDKLADEEKENWVFGGSMPFSHKEVQRALINLSRGGSDASVWREFDVPSKSFVDGGFEIPQAKSRVAWFDADHLLVGTDFGEGSLTTSGYPRIIKLWKRGTPLSEAKTLFDGKTEDVSISAMSADRPQGRIRLISRAITFFTSEYFLVDDDSTLHRVEMPESAELAEVFDRSLYFLLREPVTLADNKEIKRGSLVRLPIDKVAEGTSAIEVVLEPTERQSIQGVDASETMLSISMLDDVVGQIIRLKPDGQAWKQMRVELPANGAAGIASGNPFTDDLFVTYTSFVDPPSLYEIQAKTSEVTPTRIKQLKPKFNADDMIVERHDVASKDGTMIPYFIVRPKDAPMNGSTPTLLYAYGGFEIPMLPAYSGIIGKLWMEPGGAYVLACIRGGGEFGPAWHQAALKENRQRAYDDFLSVAEDLIKSKLTSPERLGISGASNGGLLVGAAFTQRPDLFHAVVCGVPLLDMIRYTQLLAGASWMGEYGDPEDPEMREAILRYSPYQNVTKEKSYPEVLFMTSTKDDRVHPGHARKMVAKMKSQGHPVMYFENIEGGHSAAANLLQRARRIAIEFTYLHRKLVEGK